jgi:hypothetical protein
MMNSAEISSTSRALAQRLLSFEANTKEPLTPAAPAAFLVSERLRRPLSTLVGTAGFRSLLIRALTLAKREAPILNGVKVTADGSLEGLSRIETEEGAVLIGHLVGLLATFVGETLTLRLLSDIWPNLSGIDSNSEGKESI